jgi:hypothetical protein
MQPLATGGLDKGEIELQVMTYLLYVRTFGSWPDPERSSSFQNQLHKTALKGERAGLIWPCMNVDPVLLSPGLSQRAPPPLPPGEQKPRLLE